ncbi:hypothetical protein VCHA53O466_50035 [Vibrio chagasii]|nr:hypothetical protein VCHA53O466_50035 [Vibrio chagasii]
MANVWCKKLAHSELGHVLVRAIQTEDGDGGISIQSCVQGSYNSTFGSMPDFSVKEVAERVEHDDEFIDRLVSSHYELFSGMCEGLMKEFDWFDIIDCPHVGQILLSRADAEDPNGVRPTIMQDYEFFFTSDFDLPIVSITADKVDSLFKFVREHEEPQV